jgi:hypothetical protein
MRIEICWINEQDVTDLCLRIEFLQPDRNPIGTSFLYDFYSGKAGERGSVSVRADISMLAPGRYAATYTFFQRNEFGTNRNVDCVHGLNYEIINDSEIIWDERAWGNLRLPPLVLEGESACP